VSAVPAGRARADAANALEAAIGRLLVIGTWFAMMLILAGVLLMLANGVDPLAHGAIPSFDPASVPADIVALRPEGFLWTGIALILALPVGRVAVAGLGFLAARDGRLALVSFLVLLVVITSIVAAIGLGA
jgi:uncharacterized membrane protein